MAQDPMHTVQARAQPVSGIGQAAQSVLTDTYRLLSWTILFSALTAWMSMTLVTQSPGAFALIANPLVMLGVYFFTLFMVSRNADKPSGLLWVFALTGWLGVSLGPLLYVVTSLNGFAPVVHALATTGLIFLVMSWVGRRFPAMLRMGNFLMAGILVAFVTSIVNLFLGIPTLHLVVSGAFALLSTLLIAWQTSAIVYGGERNYIHATVTLYVMMYNLFAILLSLFGASRD